MDTTCYVGSGPAPERRDDHLAALWYYRKEW